VDDGVNTPALEEWMADFRILYVDDDREILQMVGEYLARAGYAAEVSDKGLDAFERVKKEDFDLVFTDFKMPEFSGLDLLKAIKGYRPEIEVVIVTGHGTMSSAIEAMKIGSYDYLQKPFKLEQLKSIIDNLKARKETRFETAVTDRAEDRHRFHELIGLNPAMQRIYHRIDRMGAQDALVLIEGESGTGKELAARVIHRIATDGGAPFVPVNCQGPSDGRGDAGDRDGLADAVAGAASRHGTLFLNEVGNLPRRTQQSLLALLGAEGSGHGADPAPRVIATSSRSLPEAVARGQFDSELFQALSQTTLYMPSLRERKEDICLLIAHFLNRFNADGRKPIAGMSFDALDVLLRYHWPGNVIQLENVIERAFALGVETMIEVEDLPSEIKTFNEISKIG
jgi:DNA-binding NtrC family response regulator